MSAPITLVVLPSGATHLTDAGSMVAWCGVDTAGGVRFAFEPGSDFGGHKDDCKRCVAERKRGGSWT